MSFFSSSSSLKLTIALLIIIILAAVLGTLIPQNLHPTQYLQKYGHGTYHLFYSLGLTNIYHCWWFILLLSLLGLELLFCSLKRIKLRKNLDGATLTHLSILFILIGAIVSALGAERGFLSLAEGQTQDSFLVGEEVRKLDFKVYLEDFILEWYDPDVRDRQIKDFKSKVKIIEADKIVLSRTIEVNHPLKFKGYTFYQASYDPKNLNWTGLEVVRDPGIPLIYTGFVLLILGIIFTFFFPAQCFLKFLDTLR